MLLDNIKQQVCKIFIFGINKVSIGLIKCLTDNEISVIVSDTDENIVKDYNVELSGNGFVEFVNIDKVDFNLAQYFVLCKDILLEKDELNIFLTRLNNIKDKVYLDIEFISMLFSQNKYIGIIGSSYNIITNSMVNHIFDNAENNNVALSSNYIEIVKNITFDNTIFYEALQNCKIQYLQQLNFDILAILDIDSDIKKEDIINYILTNQNKESILVVNMDNEEIREIYENIGDINCKIIPISVSKMLNNGISYINRTLYNYFENNNESYDIILNENYNGNISNMSLLTSCLIAKYCDINNNIITESINNFKGVVNYLYHIEQVDNIKFVDNIGADTEKLFYEPFEVCDNIYTIFIANDKQSDLSYVKNCIKKTENIVIVDICGLLNIDDLSDKVNIIKYSNLKDAFNYIIKEIDFKDKETSATVLLSPLMSDEMNYVYYKDYVEEYKELIKGLNKC